MRASAPGWRSLGPLVLSVALVTGCSEEPRSAVGAPPPGAGGGVAEVQSLDPPAAVGALAPSLAVAEDGLLATWLEKVESEEGQSHRLMVSRLAGSEWSPPVVVAAGDDFFANWADTPALVESGGGSLIAHWLAKTGEETYAYSIELARSEDGGASWEPIGRLNADDTPTEHGFVSWLAEGDGARAFWLDGREMAAGGTMTLRTAVVGRKVGPDEILDDRVCECCITGAATTENGPLVVYRDRSLDEVRDISIVRRGEDWTRPVLVASDGWEIPGCPVNGPRVAAAGRSVVAAWFTLAGGVPTVKAAFSDDGGARFGEPVILDREQPFGRVDVVLDQEATAWVSWLARSDERAAVVVAAVAADGRVEPPIVVGRTAGGRSSGFPRLALSGGRLHVAWVEVEGEEPNRLRLARLAFDR